MMSEGYPHYLQPPQQQPPEEQHPPGEQHPPEEQSPQIWRERICRRVPPPVLGEFTLKPDTSFSRLLLLHFGHDGFGEFPLTRNSKTAPHFLHLYSKIGIL